MSGKCESLEKKYLSLCESYKDTIRKSIKKYRRKEVKELLETSFNRIDYVLKNESLTALRNLVKELEKKGMV